jgi:hypothetical protein
MHKEQTPLRTWVARVADPDLPFRTRFLTFLAPTTLWFLADAGSGLLKRKPAGYSKLLMDAWVAPILAVTFAAVWHIMSRRNR